MIIECYTCGVEFDKSVSEIKRSKTGRHFCSRTCSAKTNNKGIVRNKPVEFVCRTCGTSYTRKNGHRSEVFCSVVCREKSVAIRDEATLLELQERQAVQGKHPSWRNVYVRQHCKKVNGHKRDLGCAVCGYDKHTELAHIKPVSAFDLTATLSQVNADDNVIQLCPNHHWEFDHNGLDLTPFVCSAK